MYFVSELHYLSVLISIHQLLLLLLTDITKSLTGICASLLRERSNLYMLLTGI